MGKRSWKWATGIEDTFVAQTDRGERILDEFQITQHYENWESDLECIRKTGVEMIRYGIPWYRVEPERGKFDWSWVDKVMAYFDNHRELIPIIDLMHYGTPLWLKNEFMNSGYPECVAAYAAAFAKRYKGITKFYTPLNEPFVNAEWCGFTGTWPPYLKGMLGFALIMNQLCKGIILTVNSIKQIQSEAVLVHVEASKKYIPAQGISNEEILFWNEFRFVMWELIQGKIDRNHPLYRWAVDHHISESDLLWYRNNKIALDIIGINYYPQFSVNLITEDVLRKGKIPACVMGTGSDLKDISVEIYGRYRRPVFITETSFRGTAQQRADWLKDAIEACSDIEKAGVELYGLTWFPFFDMVDWPYRTNGLSFKDNQATFGLYSLEEMPDGSLIRIKNAAAEEFERAISG